MKNDDPCEGRNSESGDESCGSEPRKLECSGSPLQSPGELGGRRPGHARTVLRAGSQGRRNRNLSNGFLNSRVVGANLERTRGERGKPES